MHVNIYNNPAKDNITHYMFHRIKCHILSKDINALQEITQMQSDIIKKNNATKAKIPIIC